MDALSALLTDPAAPRLTTYTDAGRMELSGQTLQNWQAKVYVVNQKGDSYEGRAGEEVVVRLNRQAHAKTLLANLVANQPNSTPSITNTVNKIQSSIAQRSIASDLRLNV